MHQVLAPDGQVAAANAAQVRLDFMDGKRPAERVFQPGNLILQEGAAPVFRSADLSVDLVRRLVSAHGEEIHLSPREFDILRLLVMHAGKVLTHRMILGKLWGAGGDVQQLRVYVRQIRQKIEADPERPRHILTETGVGYRLAIHE